MERKIKVVQYGCGKMSKYTMRYVYEHGGEIVGAVDINPAVIGKDIGDIIGDDKKNVYVTDIKDAKEMLIDTKPDICIITTMSVMPDVKDAFFLCAELGINAISTCEEAFFPWNSSPAITKELDELAKRNNCTLCGSGYQDVFWGNLICTLAGSSNKITKIKGSSSYNVEDYGIALAKAHGAGLSLVEFNDEIAAADAMSEEERAKLIEEGNFAPSYMWTANGWLADKLGLTVVSQTQKCVPQIAEEDIHSTTLNMDIKRGMATGMSAVVTTTTKEGITIESECIGKVYSPKDFDKNEWTLCGEPDTTVVISRPATVELTCATIVNRIPDVISARPGFITTSNFENAKYMTRPMGEYVKWII